MLCVQPLAQLPMSFALDRARERMDLLRNSLSEAVTNSTAAVHQVVDHEGEGAHIEVVESTEPANA